MRILKVMKVGEVLLLAAAPFAASANPPLDAMPGVGDGPSLSWSQEKLTDQGYANRSRVNAAHAGDHAVTLSEEGPGDSAVGLAIDPISGEILSDKKQKH
ncbi:MAG: hypothetical protein P4L83_01970 [Nevskia sp.]|nr:hypothetical protein [Nevskia sp.]